MEKFNPNWKERDIILGIEWDKPYPYDIIRFEELSLDSLRNLIKKGFISLSERQNDSPTVEEFLTFLVKYPNSKLIGYAVSYDRPDYRVSIEGITVEKKFVTEKIKEDFTKEFSDADEFTGSGSLYAWWD